MFQQCPECHGTRGYTDVILDDGTGPFYECWLCLGEGEILPKAKGIWLTYKKLDKHEKQRTTTSPAIK